MYLGSWKIDDLLTFTAQTQVFGTGVATDADAVPVYRVYEDETTAPILTGSMALADAANTNGYYSEQIVLSVANGFEQGKSYTIRISATVSGVAGACTREFQVGGYAALIDSGAAIAVTSTTVQMRAGFIGRPKGMTMVVNSAEGYQNRVIKAFDDTTKTALIDSAWDVLPTLPAYYAVLAFGVVPVDDYADDGEMAALMAAIANVQSSVDTLQDRVLERATPADVAAAMTAALAGTAYAMAGLEAPALNPSLAYAIMLLYKMAINPKTQTPTEWALFNNDGTIKEQKQAIADTGTLARGKIVAGS